MTGSSGGATQSTLPAFVNVDLLGAYIAPGKADGTQWDGTGAVPPGVADGLATVLGQPEIGPILEYLNSAAVQALQKPDPYGTAELDTGAGFDPTQTIDVTTRDDNTENTFTPAWPHPPYPGWRGLPFGERPALQVRISLRDEDLSADDDIGTATISAAELMKAWRQGGTYWVRVDDQTQSQAIALSVQVTASAP